MVTLLFISTIAFLFLIFFKLISLADTLLLIRKDISDLISVSSSVPVKNTVVAKEPTTVISSPPLWEDKYPPDENIEQVRSYRDYLMEKRQATQSRPATVVIAPSPPNVAPQEIVPPVEPLTPAPLLFAKEEPETPEIYKEVWGKIDNAFSIVQSTAVFWKRIEQEFAARWMVWIGGITMALGIIFMLKIGNEHGLFGPLLRISAACVLSVLMVIGGEYIRRSRFHLPLMNANYIPAALSGAGIIGLYASLLAAKYLYDMFPMPVLMIGLSVVSVSAMVLALLQGPFMAALAILGAYAVPLFVSTGSGNVTGLLGYVFLVSLASMGLMNRVYRHWLWLGTMAGNYLWLLISLFIVPAEHHVARSLFLLITTYGFMAWPYLGWSLKGKIRVRPRNLTLLPQALRDPLITGYIGGILLILMTITQQHSFVSWAALIVSSLALLLLSRRSPALDLFIPLVGIFAISPMLNANRVFATGNEGVTLIALCSLAIMCMAFGMYGVIRPSYRKLWWALLSICPVLFIVSDSYFYYRDIFEAQSAKYTLLVICLFIALIWSAFADIFRRSSSLIRHTYIVSAQLALTFALFIIFSKITLTLLLASQLLLLVIWERQRQVNIPRWVFKVLVLMMLVRLSLNPEIFNYISAFNIGSWLLPWTLYGFGIPILCLWLSSRLLPVLKNDKTPVWLAANMFYLLALWINIELRHILHGSYRLSLDFSSLADCALHAVTFGIMALAYGYRERIAGTLEKPYRWASSISAGLMCLLTALCLTMFNPLWSAQNVGGLPLLNMVTVAYGIPLIFMGLALRFWPVTWLDKRMKPYVFGAIGLLGLVFISLNVRQMWHGEMLNARVIFNGEQYCYSLAWMLSAIAIMFCAIRRANQTLRRVSLGLLALTIVKLFLWDMAGLDGLYRSMAFLGLGVCLVAIGWAYQRYVVLPVPKNTEQH